MGAVPKHKVSKRRQGFRAAHQYIDVPPLTTCPTCGQKHRTHYVCRHCGHYRGRLVLDVNRQRRQRRPEA